MVIDLWQFPQYHETIEATREYWRKCEYWEGLDYLWRNRRKIPDEQFCLISTLFLCKILNIKK